MYKLQKSVTVFTEHLLSNPNPNTNQITYWWPVYDLIKISMNIPSGGLQSWKYRF